MYFFAIFFNLSFHFILYSTTFKQYLFENIARAPFVKEYAFLCNNDYRT